MKKISVFLVAALLLTMLAGCGSSVEGEASVQSVSMICGLGSVGLVDRFAGVVSARSETEIRKDEGKVIAEIAVAEGDNVTAGQLLFTYDSEAAALELEKAQLELQQMQNTVAAKESEKEQLEKDKAKAKESELLQYNLAIQEASTAIREANYNISLKEKEIERLAESMYNLEVYSPVDGRIQALNENGGYDNYGNPLPFMTVMETGTYRVKGIVNEANLGSVMEGIPVVIRSRVDQSVTWNGMISMIDWDNPQQDNNYYYGPVDEMTSSNKYPFYIELDDATGLLLGQHVFIEPNYGQTAEDVEADASVIRMPSWYICDVDTNPWVWAEGKNGKLEKRNVTLGAYDEMMDTWEIVDGLTGEDYIAYPEESLQEGMTCVDIDESAFESTDDMYADNMFVGDMIVEGVG